MTDFVENIYDFVYACIKALLDKNLNWSFLNNNMFLDNSLLGLNLTWNDFLLTIVPLTLVTIFIFLFIKFVFKLIGLVRF